MPETPSCLAAVRVFRVHGIGELFAGVLDAFSDLGRGIVDVFAKLLGRAILLCTGTQIAIRATNAVVRSALCHQLSLHTLS